MLLTCTLLWPNANGEQNITVKEMVSPVNNWLKAQMMWSRICDEVMKSSVRLGYLGWGEPGPITKGK